MDKLQPLKLKAKPTFFNLIVENVTFVLFIMGIIIVFIYFKQKNSDCSIDDNRPINKESFAMIRSKSGESYKVHEDLENPNLAADTMASLSKVASTIIEHLKIKYLDTNAIAIKEEFRLRVINGIKSLIKNFKSANMEENIPERSGGDTSYVISKGDVFAMCLRDPKNENRIDPKFNDLTFVLVHEISHIFTSTYGHDHLFWNNFKFILQEAVGMGLYDPIDYKRYGSPYCGIVITYSPIYDTDLENYKI